MKRIYGDIIWGALILVWILILIIPTSRTEFIAFTSQHAYIGGFVKFFILASMGDMLGFRIINGAWKFPQGFIFKAIIWGILGVMITLVFTVFFQGAEGAMVKGLLPWKGSRLALAFFGSLIMNTTFGPMMYVYHKFGDMLIDMIYEKRRNELLGGITIEAMVKRVDWQTLVGFSWVKSCLFIWIPLHTIVFLLPVEYRVLVSAFLSILLGILVALTKKGRK
ncbi:MAG: hypothetical protein GX892_00205 [Thermoanaerobacteraceae bacterium]|uniref:hypothetical protein n=1 Tax=Herbinix luporum TaxID=1679721 RepID=UPI00175657B2|nr:hypothetical protein [Herbinix luporum]NLZ51589.1 hypothetical protein [Thermoanaerobacteraceae bacterium]HHT58008.1 hypothetical protein [Herbinix luporum]